MSYTGSRLGRSMWWFAIFAAVLVEIGVAGKDATATWTRANHAVQAIDCRDAAPEAR